MVWNTCCGILVVEYLLWNTCCGITLLWNYFVDGNIKV